MARAYTSPVTTRIVEVVAQKPGLSLPEIAGEMGVSPDAIRFLVGKALRAQRLTRQLAPATATGPRWFYYPAVAS